MSREPVLDASGLARAAARLGSLVPGYTGYKNRERLREEDRALRDAISRQLGLVVGRMERALSATIRQLPPKDVEDADRILRALGRQRDRIRFAPEGYASMFSRKEVGERELEALLSFDAGLWATLDALDGYGAEWDKSSRSGETVWPKDEIKNALFELEDALDEREAYLRS